MNSKKWTIRFVIIILICLLFIVSVNFFVDPYGYFRAQKGENYTMDEEDYRRCRTEFDTKLMRLKCLDEHNKMIPYFEKKAEEWDYKKAGLFGKIAKVLKK